MAATTRVSTSSAGRSGSLGTSKIACSASANSSARFTMSCKGPVCGLPDSSAVVISRLAFVHFADSRSRSKSRALSMAAAAAVANARTAPSCASENTRPGRSSAR